MTNTMHRLEGENGLIKRDLNAKSTLLDVLDELDSRIKDQELKGLYSTLKSRSGSKAIPTFFSKALQEASGLLAPFVLQKMKGCLQDGLNEYNTVEIAAHDPVSLL